MAQKTIIIASITDKNNWYNIVTNENKEVSVMQTKCPKLTAILKDAKEGSEITGNYVEKDGKAYLWDLDEKKGGGGKVFTSDKKFDAAKSAAQAAASLLSLTKEPTTEQFDKWFQHIHTQICSKISSPPATESK